MKKVIYVLLIGLVVSALTSCAAEPEKTPEYRKLQEQYNALEEKYDNLKTEYDDLDSEFSSYRYDMDKFKNLSDEDLDRILAKIEKENKEKEIAQQEEEKLGYETGYTYENIARTPDEFEGKKVKFTGKLVQLLEGDAVNQGRFAVDDDYDQMILIEWFKSINEVRVLEDDIITIYGTSKNMVTYDSTLGGKITLPFVSVDKMEIQE